MTALINPCKFSLFGDIVINYISKDGKIRIGIVLVRPENHLRLLLFLALAVAAVSFCYAGTESQESSSRNDGADGPLGEWPDFTPIGFITAPHPNDSQYQTHLYGDWGGIVGEEFIFIQENKIKLMYHSYHETYMTEHPNQEDILHDWALGYDPITKIKYTQLVLPGGPYPGPAWDHTDTPGYIQHPISGEHLLYNTVRPGTKHLHPEWDGLPGWEGAIQVATSDTPPSIGIPFTQTYDNILVAELWWELGWNQNGEIKGGLSEPTPVWVPHLGTQGKVRLFYRGLNGSPSSNWSWRISYADSENGKTGWVKNPEPTFDPSDPDNPAYQWTQPWPEGFSFRGSWQAHCTGDVRADGVHMVMMVSNQNYAGYGHIAYYWSPDWGDTWIGHPDNPITAPGQFSDGVPADGFQRTPTLVVDEDNDRYIIAYNAGHDVSQKWKRWTYLATASRPSACCELPGDANENDSVNMLDITFIISYLYIGGPAPICPAQSDTNGDCTINIMDITYLITYLYKLGPTPICVNCD